MSVIESASQSVIEPKPRRWTKAEFYRMADLGWFQGQRAELVDGEIVVLSPQKFLHASTTDRACEILKDIFGMGFWVRTQLPLDTGLASLPEPDVSFVRGARGDFTDHPTQAVLVVEVSDTTLGFDRTRKAADYAAAGIGDYWIINLMEHTLEIFRDPQRDSGATSAWRYRKVFSLDRNQTVSPLALPGKSVPVAELVPA
jgi:Uma2 family endonuclease